MGAIQSSLNHLILTGLGAAHLMGKSTNENRKAVKTHESLQEPDNTDYAKLANDILARQAKAQESKRGVLNSVSERVSVINQINKGDGRDDEK